MKTVQFRQHGLSNMLEVKDIQKPVISKNQVLVKIMSSGLNHLDLWIRGGLPGLKIPLPHIPGSDGAGTIVEIGSDVNNWKVGDDVIIQPGTFCGECPSCLAGEEDLCPHYGILGETESGVQQEFVALNSENLGKKPIDMSWEAAGCLALSALTAHHMLMARAEIKSSDTVLILGGDSGVGIYGIQIAKYYGATVIASGSSESKRKFAMELGADYVINHREENFSREIKKLTAGKGVNIVFEHIGQATWLESIKSLAWNGRLVTCGSTTGTQGELNLQHLFYKRLSILGSTMGSVSDFRTIIKLAKTGAIKPVIDKVFPFPRASEAHDYLKNEHQFGKVVLMGWD
jgi:NADPH:quinone reductase-like Zn-dependent oxidoreductase